MSSHRRSANASSVPASTPLSAAIGQALHAPRARRHTSTAMLLTALVLSAPAVQAQSTEWRSVGPAGDWRSAANWTAGVPGANTDVAITTFVSDSYPLIDGGTAVARDLSLGHASGLFIDNNANFTNHQSTIAGGVFVTRGAVWNTQNVSIGTSNTTIPLPARVFVSTGASLNAQNIAIAANAGDEGSLEVDAASVSAAGEIAVGDAGQGRMDLVNGAQVGVAQLVIGQQSGSEGRVSVGSNSTLDVDNYVAVGREGAGELHVYGQARVGTSLLEIGQEAGSSGIVTVDGAGTHLESRDGAIFVGLYGDGHLTVSGGATVDGPLEFTSGYPTGIAGIHIGTYEGSRGTVIVTGEGSTLTTANDLALGGRGGEGRLEILDGGVVNNFHGFLGAYETGVEGGSGSVLVQGAGSTWNIGGLFGVGYQGDGTLEIADGGTVNAATNAIVGWAADTVGTVDVHGAGSRWNINYDLALGDEGGASLSVRDGGRVSADGIAMGSSYSQGEIRMDVVGAGSQVDAGAFLAVQSIDGSTLQIRDGAVVNSNEGSVGDWGVNSGVYYDSSGTVLIEGEGSRWNVAGGFRAGWNDGAVTVRDGGVLATGDAEVGLLYAERFGGVPGTRAEVLVDGEGSAWESTGVITVGIDDAGLLDVRNGGVVSSTGGIVGSNASSTPDRRAGLVRIDGAGSRWDVAGLTVGSAGLGRIEVGAGGTLATGMAVLGEQAGSLGEVVLDGADTRWDNGDQVFVGYLGEGSASVGNGASVLNHATWIGSHRGSRGEITVEGPGSSWTTTLQMAVGGQGEGVLRVLDGAQLDVLDLSIGSSAGGRGRMLLSGAGTHWSSDLGAYVGYIGEGELRIEDQATASSVIGFVGFQRDSRGAVVVDGPGSEWQLGGAMTVGHGKDSRGELTLSNGGRLASAEPLQLASLDGSTGILNIGAGGAAGVLETAAVGTGAGTGIVNSNHDEANLVFAPLLTGTLSVHQVGTGTTTLVSDNDYTGGTFIEDGVLQLGNGGDTGSLQGNVQVDAGGLLAFNRSNGYGFRGQVSGAGGVEQRGSGTTTFVQDQTYTGGTRIRNGVLQLGNGGETGSVIGDVQVDADGTLAFNRSNAYAFLASITGAGGVDHRGSGTTTFGGASTYTGDTHVRAGTVLVEGGLGDTRTTVHSGAMLGGTGRIGGEVIVNDGGILSPGTSPGTLTVGGLQLAAGAILDYELGQAGVIGSGINDLIEIDGDLVLDGTLNVTDAGGFGVGVYRLMNYGGSLTDNILDLGALPAGIDRNTLFVQTAIAGQVNLVNSAGISVNFWDGAAGPTDDGIIQGGNGVWVANDRSWTLPDGSLNGHWNEGFAVFGGQAGTVTVMGEQRFTGMQFMTDGYRLEPGTDAALRASGTTNLRVDPGVTATIAAPIVGDATLVKVDEGTLVLEGGFGYTGGVTVNGGRLVGDTGNLLGDILNRAELEFAQAEDATYADTISGSGQLIKSAQGTLTLTGTNTYTGSTRIEAGTLRIGNGGTAGSLVGDVRIDAAGTLAFDRSDSVGFAGAFSGAGALDKFGAGTLTLTGDSGAYTGQATLHAGGLHMLGTIGGQFDVLAGTVLSGTGTLGSVDNAGTISPGGSIGTLHMTGDYVQREGSTYLVDIAPNGSSDLLDIAGSATIEGGEVYVTKAPGQYAGVSRYTIVDAEGGVTGTYDTLDQNLPFLDMFLSYDPNHVYLDIRRNDTDFSSLCGRGTFNQCEVAKTLDSFDPQVPPSADIGKMMEQVTAMDEDTALAAFDRMSGEVHPSLAGIVLEGHALYGQTVSRRMADRREAIGADRLHGGAWVRTYGANSELDGDGNAHAADWNLHGIAVGYDAWGTEHWLIGASANLMRLDADFRPGDHGEVEANNLSLYTSFQGDRGYFDAVGSYAWWDNDTTRAVQVGDIDRTATANYRSHRFTGYLEAGWNIQVGARSLLQPLVTLQYDNLASQKFREQGAQDLSLIALSDSVERLTAAAGVRWSSSLQRGAWTLEPTAQARWLHSEGQGYAEFDVAFSGAPDQGYRTPQFGWRVRGVTLPQDRGLVGFGLAARKGNIDLFVDYDFQAGDGFQAHNLGAGLRYRW